MAEFLYLLVRIAGKSVMVHDDFPVDSWRAIRAMKAVGLLVRIGPTKGGYWEVCE